jgi:DnaJ-class molecular chaperone
VFDHATTGYPLQGAHQTVTCQRCHGDGVYRGKSTTCVSCHQADYNGTTNPNHRTQGFPTDCTRCHGMASFRGASFDHNTTRFPLTGAHLAVNCLGCHGDGVYAGKPTTCISCHQAQYTASTQPPHQTLSFPTTCQDCHTTAGWPGASYDHSTTQFPLTGAHRTVACQQCHGDGVYRGKPTTCVSCHLADYNGTTDPNHRTARFPTDCLTCHTTTGWTGATFNHDSQWFPIYSGAHRGRWNSCADCHTNNSNYAVFTCLTCHTRSSTDSHHSGISGYRYDSQACYTCHPRGSH